VLLDAVLRFNPAPDLWMREFDVIATLAATVPAWALRRSRSTTAREVGECVARLWQPTNREGP